MSKGATITSFLEGYIFHDSDCSDLRSRWVDAVKLTFIASIIMSCSVSDWLQVVISKTSALSTYSSFWIISNEAIHPLLNIYIIRNTAFTSSIDLNRFSSLCLSISLESFISRFYGSWSFPYSFITEEFCGSSCFIIEPSRCRRPIVSFTLYLFSILSKIFTLSNESYSFLWSVPFVNQCLSCFLECHTSSCGIAIQHICHSLW